MDWFMGRSKKKDSYSNLATAASQSSTKAFKVEKDVLKMGLLRKELVNNMVQKPEGVDINEWVATQTVMLFENINLLCGCLSDYCKPLVCPTMNGPNHVQYTWSDGRGKVCKMTACEYIDCITAYIHSYLIDENIFPTKYGNIFPSNFKAVVGNIHRLLCHILVHSYHSHLPHLTALNLTRHYTTILHHFLSFNFLFNLASPSDLSLFDDVLLYLESGDGDADDEFSSIVAASGVGVGGDDESVLNLAENFEKSGDEIADKNCDYNDPTFIEADVDTNCDKCSILNINNDSPNNTNATNPKHTTNNTTNNNTNNDTNNTTNNDTNNNTNKNTNNSTNKNTNKTEKEANTRNAHKPDKDTPDNIVHSYSPVFTIVT